MNLLYLTLAKPERVCCHPENGKEKGPEMKERKDPEKGKGVGMKKL